MHFVALDLETTGLSPTTDTIIEVAAVAFDIEKNSEGRYEATNIVEHSQLVYPEREMTEEISMITGITDEMLSGKPIWSTIKDKVREFIGDESIIVGHNVLFDIAMLGTHDIDLSSHGIIDTFELSEILSQDIESLNLGYLAGAYGLSAGDKEHRALGDTRLSVGLFVHYLNKSLGLPKNKKTIFALAGQHEEKANLGLFAEILGWEKITEPGKTWIPGYYTAGMTEAQNPEIATKDPITHSSSLIAHNYSLTSLPLGRESEKEFLMKNIVKGIQTSIGVFGHVQTGYMKTLIEELGYSAEIYRAKEEYCSIEELRERIARGSWKRKEAILITKLLYWLEDTPTGLLRELKLYGEERDEIVYFRTRAGEDNQYYHTSEESISHADVIIYDMARHLNHLVQSKQSREETKNTSRATTPPGGQEQDTMKPTGAHTSYLMPHTSSTLIIKDITLLEESMRRAQSTHISIENLISALSEFDGTERLREIMRFIEAMYLTFPVRPTGPEVSPPGGYGETYFLPQSEIWHRGCVSLSLLNSSLLEALGLWRESQNIQTRREGYLIDSIEKSLIGLLRFHHEQSSSGVIIEVRENCLSLSLIPRDVQDDIAQLLSLYSEVTLYGVGMGGAKIQEFLRHEVGITGDIEQLGEDNKKSLIVNPYATIELKKTGSLGGAVILTTSAKHIREIGKSLEKTGLKILMQGISGGKGKQLGLFIANPESTVLIGTIDMWREELELWNHAKHIILAKLPFDPPTDAYFLARTVGMKNNFALYSEPMLIIKVNTLLSRIYSSTYTGAVYCEDARLTETVWGKELAHEIV